MKKIFIGLLLAVLPMFALANTAQVIENETITTEVVTIDASSEVSGTTVEMQTVEVEDWICFFYWELDMIIWEFDDMIIIEYAYYEEWWCFFW